MIGVFVAVFCFIDLLCFFLCIWFLERISKLESEIKNDRRRIDSMSNGV